MRAKIWSKYAKDVMSFVEKRTSLELEWARGLTKLAQTMRPVLKEESYLPFQSIYCTALDQDLEMCATTQVWNIHKDHIHVCKFCNSKFNPLTIATTTIVANQWLKVMHVNIFAVINTNHFCEL